MRWIRLGTREVDLEVGLVRSRDGEARLSTRERALLRFLARRPNEVVERDVLLTEVFGFGPTSLSRAVDSTVRRLRVKVEADPATPRFLLKEHGVGYRLVLDDLVGRDGLLAEVRAALQRERVVVLRGGPGIGKTAVARAMGARVWVACREEVGLVEATAEALGVRTRDPAAIARALDGLLVLDGWAPDPEARAVLDGWLEAVPTLKVLVTTRAPWEGAIEVPGLGREDAVALLERAAGRTVAAVEPGGNPGEIRLAGARLRLGEDASGARTEVAPDALPPDLADAAAACAVFEGPFTEEDAEGLGVSTEALTALHARAWVERTAGRWRVPGSLRPWLTERAPADLAGRHARWFARLGRRPVDGREAIETLVAAGADLEAAWRHATRGTVAPAPTGLLADLAVARVERALLRGPVERIPEIVARARGAEPADLARVLLAAALPLRVCGVHGAAAEALALAEQAGEATLAVRARIAAAQEAAMDGAPRPDLAERALAEAGDDPALQAAALGVLGRFHAEGPAAVDLLQRSVLACGRSGDRVAEAAALGRLADAWFEQGEVAEAESLYRESLAAFEALGDRDHVFFARVHLASALHVRHRLDAALEAYERAAGEAAANANPVLEAHTRSLWGWALAQAGRIEAGLALVSDLDGAPPRLLAPAALVRARAALSAGEVGEACRIVEAAREGGAAPWCRAELCYVRAEALDDPAVLDEAGPLEPFALTTRAYGLALRVRWSPDDAAARAEGAALLARLRPAPGTLLAEAWARVG